MYKSQTYLFDYGTSLIIMKENYVDESEKHKGMMNYTICKFNEFCKEENINLEIDLL